MILMAVFEEHIPPRSSSSCHKSSSIGFVVLEPFVKVNIAPKQ